MARIKVNPLCNVLTNDDSHAYRSMGRPVRPQITIPSLRARLYVEDARTLAQQLIEAVEFAERLEKEQS